MNIARPNTGLRYKQFSLGFTKEMDEKVKQVNALPGFRSCTYADCVRFLVDAGVDAIWSRYPACSKINEEKARQMAPNVVH
ncbi:MAG: hypothetical protein IJT94_11055 [Oscillibacter sp.]|nr:hypothetical protein [Oscillibacter sp.]